MQARWSAPLKPGLIETLPLLLQEAAAGQEITDIAICTGPGSFTGLRTSIALAQGFAAGAGRGSGASARRRLMRKARRICAGLYGLRFAPGAGGCFCCARARRWPVRMTIFPARTSRSPLAGRRRLWPPPSWPRAGRMWC
ncbi:hypothetical protein GT370_13615 [Acidocella sp. MX-AZ03]|nr:hypothetical protein [Acidocella sp. MX-AZ03]WBO61196.1 hypothetical protein GT370_13615 [Acidocella sp. MX-AZ03]